MGQRGREFARIDPRAAGEPVPRRELEVAIMRPVRQDAEHLVEVDERVDAVQPTAGDDAEE